MSAGAKQSRLLIANQIHRNLANNYGPPPGSAEENFGRLLREDFTPYRDELIISTKAGYTMWQGPYGDWGSKKYLVASLNQSLKRLGLDYVDIFYHHRPVPDTPLAGGVLTDRYLNGIPEDSRAASQSQFLSGAQLTEEKMAKVRRLNAIAVARGQKLVQMALAWVLRGDRVTSVLIGASKTAQIDDAVAMLANRQFSERELADIDAILAGI